MRLTGAHPSPADHRDDVYAFQRSDLYVGSAAPSRTSVDVVDLHTWRVQGAGSCVSYATVEQIQDLATAQGDPLPLLSGAALYARARMLGMAPVPGVGLPDTGSSCRLNLKAARDYGVLEESEYADVPEHITRVPPASVWSAVPTVKISTFRRIRGEGDPDTLRMGIIAALQFARLGKCSLPSSVMMVDDAYGALGDTQVYDKPGGKQWGWHCQTIGAFDAGYDAVAMLSSWGARRYWVSVPWLAMNGLEFWLFEGLNRQPKGSP
jgi:hypothetical protein